jgi:uncharacterized protein
VQSHEPLRIAVTALINSAPDHANEWPLNVVDPNVLWGDDGRPMPFREFVLKVSGRCNLVCDYCYVYSGADRSWRTRPATMPAAVVVQAARRIAEHALRHGLAQVRVVLHGGEPLLVGPGGIDFAATELRRRLPTGVGLDLQVQTNGVLLDEAFMTVMHAHRIGVGVSLDGDRRGHDLHRRRADGRGSHEDAARALRLLGTSRHRGLFAGILSVVDVRSDPVRTYEALLEFGPPSVDLLLPHGNWTVPPPARDAGEGETPYADWLIACFDRWYHAPVRETRVVLFEEIIGLLLGGDSRSEQVGLSPATFVIIDTDGTLQQTDTLKSSYPGAPETGLDVFAHLIDAASSHPAVIARQIGTRALAEECLRCDVVRVCGGGNYPHRYRQGAGFRNRSVYCADLMSLIGHVRRTIVDELRRAGR